MLTRAVTNRFPDRLPTGTPRLDDLLLGGIPPKGHIILIGDAFVGKEVGVYAFLTEGLKRGEGAIIISAARAPEEVEQKIGLVTPQFHEYEQLDMVRWVDASSGEAMPVDPDVKKTHHRVAGPAGPQGDLQALVQAVNSLGNVPARPIRVAFLGLSACLANADDRERLQFIQNFVGALKTRSAIALYALDRDPAGDPARDGPRADGRRDLLQARGGPDLPVRAGRRRGRVQGFRSSTRATNRALVIGSFALERIR